MSYFASAYAGQTGTFQHRETKCWFEFRPCTHEYGLKQGFTHEIAVSTHGINGDCGFRFARILKTVAKILVDEDEIESWPIRLSKWSNL